MLLRHDKTYEHKDAETSVKSVFDCVEVASMLAIPNTWGSPMKMNDLFDRYIKECLPDLAPRTQRDYMGIMQTLRQTFGDKEPRDIKPRHVADFLNVDKGRIHRNRMVTILSTVFYKAIGKWCVDDDLHNPCTPVEKWPTPARSRYIDDKEFYAFRATARAQVQIAMDLALLTAQRQSDIIGMTWDQVKAIGVKRADWRIEVQQGKTGKKLAISIHAGPRGGAEPRKADAA